MQPGNEISTCQIRGECFSYTNKYFKKATLKNSESRWRKQLICDPDTVNTQDVFLQNCNSSYACMTCQSINILTWVREPKPAEDSADRNMNNPVMRREMIVKHLRLGSICYCKLLLLPQPQHTQMTPCITLIFCLWYQRHTSHVTGKKTGEHHCVVTPPVLGLI